MVLSARALMIAAASTACLAAGPVFARTPSVNDQAHLFSPAVRQEADERIAQIQRQYHDSLLIETFDKIPWYYNFNPWSRGYQARQTDEAAKAQFFAEWAKRRARKAGDQGIYIMIDQPGGTFHVQVEVGPSPQVRKAFPASAQAALRQQLLASLQQKHADEGLLQTVRFVQDQLETNLASSPPPSALGWLSVGWIMLALVGSWLFLECLRFLWRGRAAVGAIAATSNGGGSSLPGLFEAMTCTGIRDVFRRNAPAPDHGPPPGQAQEGVSAAADGSSQAGKGLPEEEAPGGNFDEAAFDHRLDEPAPETRWQP